MAIEKKIGLIAYLFLIIGFIVASYISHENVSPPLGGETICFIMGEDTGDETFYKLGKEHFQEDTSSKTDVVITHIRSLESLANFLNKEKREIPWSRIELVLHGNTWSGLSTDILDGGERAYPKDLLKAVLSNQLPQLHSGIVDTNTIINIWGCGIGRNPILNIALDRYFTDIEDIVPKVNASRDFVIFRRTVGGEPAKRLKANYWPFFFKRGLRPSDTYIANQLKKEYPDEEKSWFSILQNDSKSNDDFQKSFHVPVSWTVIYDQKEDRPSVSTKEEKMDWVQSQPSLIKKIEELEIPIDRYNWTVNKIIHTKENGEKVPAIKAIGMSTVLCVLEEGNEQNARNI